MAADKELLPKTEKYDAVHYMINEWNGLMSIKGAETTRKAVHRRSAILNDEISTQQLVCGVTAQCLRSGECMRATCGNRHIRHGRGMDII